MDIVQQFEKLSTEYDDLCSALASPSATRAERDQTAKSKTDARSKASSLAKMMTPAEMRRLGKGPLAQYVRELAARRGSTSVKFYGLPLELMGERLRGSTIKVVYDTLSVPEESA